MPRNHLDSNINSYSLENSKRSRLHNCSQDTLCPGVKLLKLSIPQFKPVSGLHIIKFTNHQKFNPLKK